MSLICYQPCRVDISKYRNLEIQSGNFGYPPRSGRTTVLNYPSSQEMRSSASSNQNEEISATLVIMDAKILWLVVACLKQTSELFIHYLKKQTE
jgi:hypothetical protein